MKKLLFLLIGFMVCEISFAQKRISVIICSTDTLLISPVDNRRYLTPKDSVRYAYELTPYKAVRCIVPTKLGLRYDLGITGYYYGRKTKEWLGNFYGPNFALAISYDKISFGARFKPWTLNPKKELNFNGNTLPLNAAVNPIKIDFYAGYSFDFDYLISVEPQIGYTKSLFYVINENILNQTYSIPESHGLLIGCSVNKYFKIRPNDFFAVFLNMGYATNNFAKSHTELDRGYFEWSLGVSIKSFYRSTKLRRIVE